MLTVEIMPRASQRRHARLWCGVFLLVCTAAHGTAQTAAPLIEQALQYEGRVISRIEFSPAAQPLSTADLEARLPFHAGSTFHEHQLRDAIQSLFATGRFADLAVDASDQNGQFVLRFLTKPAYFVGHVTIYGIKTPPNSGQLYGAAKLRLGAAYLDSDKAEAEASMRSLLRQNGFYYGRIDSAVYFDPVRNSANVTFNIEPGKRARFEQPLISGDPERADASIIRATHWQRLYGMFGWHQVTETRVRQGLDNVRRFYERRNLLRAHVNLSGLSYHHQTNSVQPALRIEAGTEIVVRVVGARFSRGKLRQVVPVFQEQSVDTDLLVEGQQSIQQYLQSEGYFAANVTYRLQEDGKAGKTIITYTVERGNRYKFVHLEITGNHYFPEQTLRERLYLEPAEFPRFPHGRYGSTYLQEDIQAIQSLYVSNGFRDVKVTSRVEENYRNAHNRLAVFVHVDEGTQTFVSSLKIGGVSETDLRTFSALLASSNGQPFSEASVALDRENILNYYYDRGFLNAVFEYSVEAVDAGHVRLTYTVRPGEQKFVRDVLVMGLESTRAKLVNDRIELKPGEPLSLSEETDSQRRLYNLGIFARVNTALQNPNGDENSKYVLYDIDEARHYSLNFGVGAQIARIGGGVTTLDNPAGTTGFAPRLAVGINRENFLGLGQTLSLQTSASTIEQRAALTYFIPQFVSHENLNLTTTVLLDNSNDVRTFTAHRREASMQLGERLSRAYTLQYRLVFRHVTQSNVKIDQLLIPLLSQPETVGLAEVSFIQDKRDDPTDAHHGIYTTVDAGYASSLLGSQTQFARLLFRNSTYYQLHRDLVLARGTQFGLISRTGGHPSIPLAERLYSGGSTSIRAFPDFQAGPRDLVTGFPLGGNALFINNVELRFPLYGDNLGGVIFQDSGNVYTSISDFSARFRQRNLQDFNYMVQNVGFGIRYRTPIGPIRVDLSVSPDAPRFFGLKGTLQDYLNGTASSTVQKINAFQFHISLGQAF